MNQFKFPARVLRVWSLRRHPWTWWSPESPAQVTAETAQGNIPRGSVHPELLSDCCLPCSLSRRIIPIISLAPKPLRPSYSGGHFSVPLQACVHPPAPGRAGCQWLTAALPLRPEQWTQGHLTQVSSPRWGSEPVTEWHEEAKGEPQTM